MKQTALYSLVALSAALLIPMGVAAQDTPDDAPPIAEEPPVEEALEDAEDEESTDEESTEGEGDAEVALEGDVEGDAEAEISVDAEADVDVSAETAPVDPDPEPELAATEVENELPAPTLDEDLAAATEDEDVLAEVEIEEEEEEAASVPWRNSAFLWDHSMNTTAFDPGSVITPNPTYSMGFSFQPRWYFTDDLSVRLRQDLSVELTDTDSRVRNREPVLADTRLELFHSNIVKVEDFSVGAGVRVYLPLSVTSRAREMIMRPGVIVSGSYAFPDVMEGLSLGLTSTYDYRIASSNVILREEDVYVQNFATSDSGADLSGQAGASGQVDHSGTVGLSASLGLIENLGVSTSFTWWWTHAGSIANADVPVASAPGGSVSIEDGSASRTRLLTWFTLGVDYQFTDWLNVELGYANLTSELNPSGTRRNPFWSTDSSVSLTAGITLDKVYAAFVGTDSSVADADSEGATASAEQNRGNH